MSKFLKSTALITALALVSGPAFAEKFGLGRAALPEEIAAWDGDVQPNGVGLPVGSGDAIDGEEIFADQCAACHGDFAEGIDNWPKLAGGADTLDHEDPLKTVGSYWPYLSTAYDYIKRSMPYGNAGTLSDDEVYQILAYILYSNDLIEDDFVLSNETFFDVEMPNADGFIVDNRAETEYAIWSGE
ncbi:MAG: c-type cytochrome, partial [Sedimentitalea sp.]